jgi:hypothetical protein
LRKKRGGEAENAEEEQRKTKTFKVRTPIARYEQKHASAPHRVGRPLSVAI